jgi:hypothetical protein
MNIYIIISIIIFIIILSVSLYFSLRPNNKPSSFLNTCKNNQTQCGTGCYDKIWQSCDKDKNICDSMNFSQDNDECCIFPKNLHDKIQVDDKGNQKKVGKACCQDEYWSSSGNVCCPTPVCGGFCCENEKYCDYSIVGDNEKNKTNNNPCVECPYDLCGKNCCLFNEKCFTGPSGTTSCCNPYLWDPDKKICCNGSTGAVSGINCKPGGNPQCTNPVCNKQQTCISNDTCCNDVYDKDGKPYICINQNFAPTCCPKDGILDKCQLLKNGQYICCEDGFILDTDLQRCVQICGNQKCDPNLSSCVGTNDGFKYCQTKDCVWDASSNYDPPNVGKNNVIFSYNGPKGLKYYYAFPTSVDINENLNRSITYQEKGNNNKCKIDDCTGKIKEEGGTSIFDINSHKCIGNYSASSLLPPIAKQPPCPHSGSCVIENEQLTGQICLNSTGDSQKAYNGNVNNIFKMQIGDCICNKGEDPATNNCKIYDDSLCNNFGTLNNTTGKCECTNSTGDYCQNNIQCPTNCSGNGTCNYNNGICTCNDNYTNSNCLEPVIRIGDPIYNTWIFRWWNGTEIVNTQFFDNGNGSLITNKFDTADSQVYKYTTDSTNENTIQLSAYYPTQKYYGIPSVPYWNPKSEIILDPVTFTFYKNKNIYTSDISKTIIFNKNHLNFQSSPNIYDNPDMNKCVEGFGPINDCSRKLYLNTPSTVNMNCRGSSVSWDTLNQSCKDTLGSNASVIQEKSLTCDEDNCDAGNWRYACTVSDFYAQKNLSPDIIKDNRCIYTSYTPSDQFLLPNGFMKYN